MQCKCRCVEAGGSREFHPGRSPSVSQELASSVIWSGFGQLAREPSWEDLDLDQQIRIVVVEVAGVFALPAVERVGFEAPVAEVVSVAAEQEVAAVFAEHLVV